MDCEKCDYKTGRLPVCAPLGIGTIPAQCSDSPRYDSGKALVRGTLFPGLDLPLGNIVNSSVPDVPAAELMALDFAAHDLSLYLDTHPHDREAFDLYKELLSLAKEGRERYEALYGPVCKTELVHSDSYSWIQSPWPWDCGKED